MGKFEMRLREIATRLIRFLITFIRLVYRAIPLPPSLRNSINALMYRRLAWVRFQMLLRELSSNWTVRDEEIPKVSIIIPVFGKVEVTLSCIRSIASNPQKNSFEVIVVNDGSKDSTKDWIGKLSGVRLINNQENLGFIQSCNNGAAAARGEFLHFLNNDTIVTSNWLDELVWTHESFTDVGLVGSKLLYPDGKLQEAGAIVWQDGSAWNYGRGHDPDRPEYNYARQVDYCSGASILISKENFQNLGGFDTHFSPAYYEDTDLAQKVTNSGLKVIYQPASVVYHIEGSTSGKDLTQGTKQYQVTNGEKFASRWADYLANHGKPGENPDQEKDRFAKKRILFLDHLVPTPDKDAGSGVAINTMLLLREFGFQVTFAAPKNLVSERSEGLLLQKHGIEVLHYPYVESLEEHLGENGSRYDLVLVCRADVLEYSLPIIKNHCPGIPVVFHTADLHFLRLEREAKLTKDWAIEKKAQEYRKLEPWLMEQTELTIVHGNYEKDLLVSMGVDSNKLVVFPLMINFSETIATFDARSGIVFIGGFNHTPNVDSIKFMCREVMPTLLSINPEIVLSIVGSNVTREIEDLETSNVKIVGYVKELDEYLQTFKISVAPLRFGAGIKGKVARAMASGTPVVASRIAMEGIDLTPDSDFLLANSAEELAGQINALYNNKQLWETISRNSYDHSRGLFGFESATRSLREVLLKLEIHHEIPSKEVKFV
jgi:O-antigen biosynthesis protein